MLIMRKACNVKNNKSALIYTQPPYKGVLFSEQAKLSPFCLSLAYLILLQIIRHVQYGETGRKAVEKKEGFELIYGNFLIINVN